MWGFVRLNLNKCDYFSPNWLACVSQIPIDWQMSSSVRWFSQLVSAVERLSMCQFHSCADFNHYTLRYSCVHHLIQHIKPFKVLLVKYDSLHPTPSLSFCVCLLALPLSLSPFVWIPLSLSLRSQSSALSSKTTAVSLKNPSDGESPSSSAGKWPCLSGVCVCVSLKYIPHHL